MGMSADQSVFVKLHEKGYDLFVGESNYPASIHLPNYSQIKDVILHVTSDPEPTNIAESLLNAISGMNPDSKRGIQEIKMEASKKDGNSPTFIKTINLVMPKKGVNENFAAFLLLVESTSLHFFVGSFSDYSLCVLNKDAKKRSIISFGKQSYVISESEYPGLIGNGFIKTIKFIKIKGKKIPSIVHFVKPNERIALKEGDDPNTKTTKDLDTAVALVKIGNKEYNYFKLSTHIEVNMVLFKGNPDFEFGYKEANKEIAKFRFEIITPDELMEQFICEGLKTFNSISIYKPNGGLVTASKLQKEEVIRLSPLELFGPSEKSGLPVAKSYSTLIAKSGSVLEISLNPDIDNSSVYLSFKLESNRLNFALRTLNPEKKILRNEFEVPNKGYKKIQFWFAGGKSAGSKFIKLNLWRAVRTNTILYTVKDICNHLEMPAFIDQGAIWLADMKDGFDHGVFKNLKDMTFHLMNFDYYTYSENDDPKTLHIVFINKLKTILMEFKDVPKTESISDVDPNVLARIDERPIGHKEISDIQIPGDLTSWERLTRVGKHQIVHIKSTETSRFPKQTSKREDFQLKMNITNTKFNPIVRKIKDQKNAGGKDSRSKFIPMEPIVNQIYSVEVIQADVLMADPNNPRVWLVLVDDDKLKIFKHSLKMLVNSLTESSLDILMYMSDFHVKVDLKNQVLKSPNPNTADEMNPEITKEITLVDLEYKYMSKEIELESLNLGTVKVVAAYSSLGKCSVTDLIEFPEIEDFGQPKSYLVLTNDIHVDFSKTQAYFRKSENNLIIHFGQNKQPWISEYQFENFKTTGAENKQCEIKEERILRFEITKKTFVLFDNPQTDQMKSALMLPVELDEVENYKFKNQEERRLNCLKTEKDDLSDFSECVIKTGFLLDLSKEIETEFFGPDLNMFLRPMFKIQLIEKTLMIDYSKESGNLQLEYDGTTLSISGPSDFKYSSPCPSPTVHAYEIAEQSSKRFEYVHIHLFINAVEKITSSFRFESKSQFSLEWFLKINEKLKFDIPVNLSQFNIDKLKNYFSKTNILLGSEVFINKSTEKEELILLIYDQKIFSVNFLKDGSLRENLDNLAPVKKVLENPVINQKVIKNDSEEISVISTENRKVKKEPSFVPAKERKPLVLAKQRVGKFAQAFKSKLRKDLNSQKITIESANPVPSVNNHLCFGDQCIKIALYKFNVLGVQLILSNTKEFEAITQSSMKLSIRSFKNKEVKQGHPLTVTRVNNLI